MSKISLENFRTLMYQNVYNTNIFNYLLEDISRITDSEITENDVLRTGDGVRIDLKQKSLPLSIHSILKDYYIKYCDGNENDILPNLIINITRMSNNNIVLIL